MGFRGEGNGRSDLVILSGVMGLVKGGEGVNKGKKHSSGDGLVGGEDKGWS